MTGPQAPPGKKHRPAGNRAADEQTGGGKSLEDTLAPPDDNPERYTRRHIASCIHGRPRFCQPCVTRRRRVAFLLDELLADLYPGGWDR